MSELVVVLAILVALAGMVVPQLSATSSTAKTTVTKASMNEVRDSVLQMWSDCKYDFDTTTGAKQDAESYRTIAHDLDLPASEIVFLSDLIPELNAAKSSGFNTIHVRRDETVPPSSAHQSVRNFQDIHL